MKKRSSCYKSKNNEDVFHYWSDWEDEEGNDTCKKAIRCKNCGALKEEKRFHNWSDWEIEESDESCKKVIRCKDCRILKEEKYFHDWDEWKSVKNGYKCERERKCKNCDEKQTHFVHKWKEHEHEGVCFIINECEFCEKKYSVRKKHIWGDWEQSAEVSKRICRRCGNSEKCTHTSTETRYEERCEYISSYYSRSTKYCSNCGYVLEKTKWNGEYTTEELDRLYRSWQ